MWYLSPEQTALEIRKEVCLSGLHTLEARATLSLVGGGTDKLTQEARGQSLPNDPVNQFLPEQHNKRYLDIGRLFH